MTLYDGKSHAASMIGAYCGNDIPTSYTTSSNEVLIHFQSQMNQNSIFDAKFIFGYHPYGKKTNQKILFFHNSNWVISLWDTVTMY